MRNYVALTDTAALTKIKNAPSGHFLFLSWLRYLCNSRADLIQIGQEIDNAKEKL